MAKESNKQDLVVTRIIDASLEKVWKAWTDPEYVKLWWGPKDYISPKCEIDLREGGKFIFGMRAPDYQGGFDSYVTGVYKKIVPMKQLEFTQSMSDKDGNLIDPATMGEMFADMAKEMRTKVIFKAKGDLTEIVITEYGWEVRGDGKMYVYALAGMHQSIDKMAESLAKKA